MNWKDYIAPAICALLSNSHAMAVTESVSVNDISLALDNQQCSVTSLRQPVHFLEIRPQCYFVRVEQTQKIHIEQTGRQRHVLLVVGSPVRNRPQFPITMTRHDCGNQLKAVIIDDSRISVSKNTLTNKLFCAGLGVDKEYFQLLGK